MFLAGQVNFFSQLVLGQVDFCNISTALSVCLMLLCYSKNMYSS